MRRHGLLGVALALALALAAVMLLGGCGGSCNEQTEIPSAFRGTWVVAALDAEGELYGAGLFDVDRYGGVDVSETEVFFSGGVTEAGTLTLNGGASGNVLTAKGSMRHDDTGDGTWETTSGGTQVEAGTFLVWRANGGAYAGVWDVEVAGDYTGTGAVTVDSNGVGRGTIVGSSITAEVVGVVTGSGLVVVAWGAVGDDYSVVTTGPANGSASGSVASGAWNDAAGLTGTWTATKR